MPGRNTTDTPASVFIKDESSLLATASVLRVSSGLITNAGILGVDQVQQDSHLIGGSVLEEGQVNFFVGQGVLQSIVCNLLSRTF